MQNCKKAEFNGRMSKKYDPLGAFLEKSDSDNLALSFDQIERMIGGLLPASARKYGVWWSNSPVEGRHNEVWLRRGWLTADINLKSRTFVLYEAVLLDRADLPQVRRETLSLPLNNR